MNTENTTLFNEADWTLTRDTIYRSSFTSVADIVETVRRWGIIVFPGLLSQNRLVRLNAEFDVMIAHRNQMGFPLDEYGNLVNIRLQRPKLAQFPFRETESFFAESFMSETAAAYFAPDTHRLNGEIFVSQLTETQGVQTAPPFALHFDRRQVLKFFVYLTDTDERNGAMRTLPGSNLHNRIMRQTTMREGAISAIPNTLPEPEMPSLPVTGPAGTLFIFDTDVAHGASSVQAGHVRRTMRGHTHSHAMLQAMGIKHGDA